MSAKFYTGLWPDFKDTQTDEQEVLELRAVLDMFTSTFSTAEEVRAEGGVPVRVTIDVNPEDDK